MKPKVSIIVPIYNTAKYLPNCLDSIINQTYQNLEIILVNDGSTDNSEKIIEKYAKKDSRIKIISQKNSGQSTARNAGLKKATGDYIGFVDSDDEVSHIFIEQLIKPYLTDPQTSLSVCGLRYNWLKTNTQKDVFINPIRPKRKNESQKSYILFLLTIDGRMYSSVNKLYLTNHAKKCQFNINLNFAEDTKFVLDYLKKTKGNISFILKPLYTYNFGTETSTISKTATNWQNWQTSYNNLKNWLGNSLTIKERFWLHAVHLRWRISYLRSKRRAK